MRYSAVKESVLVATLLSLLLRTTSAQTGNATAPAASCPLNCANGGICEKGTADYSKHPTEENGTPFLFLQETSRDGWYCNCPKDWTGIFCGRPYTVCPAREGETGNPHICYHGGTCIEGMENNTNISSDQRFCDCSKAQHNGVPYFGQYCELEGAKQCAPGSDVFCTSGGTCVDDFEEKAHPCSCPEGHRGPHCEFLRGQVPDCVLPCQNKGECTLGLKSYQEAEYQNLWSTHDGSYQYCSCPTGWFGNTCEVPGVKCGNAHCFNGGACLETLNKNGQKTYACDCRMANHDGKSYAGQYCEAAATSSCANAPSAGNLHHPNGHLFCTNNGECKQAAHLGCECPEGKHGPSCEFNNAADASCSLLCQNGGTCRKGSKDISLINSLGKDLNHYNISRSQFFEHCVCPDGYFGLQCEHKLEICPGGDHVCLHGSKCVAQNEGENTSHKCDCDEGFDAVERYAGKFCQYASTDICTKNGQPGVGKANFAFCVNNGICKAKVGDNDPHPGCTCEEGFTGDHCEFLDSSGATGATSNGSSSSPGSAASASVSGQQPSDVEQANQSVIIAVSSLLVAMLAVSGFFVSRSMLGGGRFPNKGKTAAEAGAAVAEAEHEASAGDVTDSASFGSGQQPFDENLHPSPKVAPARFDEDDGEFEDVDDYSNDPSDTSTLTEDDTMSSVQIV
ncbi:EGF-like domain containing protein [Nitzschia inconspicua]|uniref:EGF-like domain containing protein n=1 Tax=Nitzschia inconspicua TaxID=303405 RepID=A0A9K3PUK8_9STRA|nr:EGF-like domain containing protein [Nitzschia inconspicua]